MGDGDNSVVVVWGTVGYNGKHVGESGKLKYFMLSRESVASRTLVAVAKMVTTKNVLLHSTHHPHTKKEH